MIIGNRCFDLENKCYIMGILNFTPDSFSDGGRYNSLDSALFRVQEMLCEGMDILDIGGMSTRPGYTEPSAEEECMRVVPLIEAVKKRFDVPVSLDTYRHTVAREGIRAGADMINDIWGFRLDSGEMAQTVAESGVSCCLMHNRKSADYSDLLGDIESDLRESLSIAEGAGIPRDKIVLDAGIGLPKNQAQNLEVLRCLGTLKQRLAMPFLLGASRKSVIGNVLGLPTEERLEGTLAVNTCGVISGAGIVRVHDIKENARAVKMALALRKGYENG